MTQPVQNVFTLAARLLFVFLFLPAGISKLTGFAGTVGYIASVGLPFASLGAVVAIVVEVLGGVALLVGLRTRAAAVVLAGFTLAASVFFHAYWSMPADQAAVQQLLFTKNLAVVGGLLALAVSGAGQWSIDARRK